MGNAQPKTANHPIPTLFRALGPAAWGLAAALASAALPAMAFERDFTVMTNRRDLLTAKDSEIRIEGGLSCRAQNGSREDRCALRLEDFHTGKVFSLIDGAAALEMYRKGLKTVAVVGKISDAGLLEIRSIESL